MKSKSFFVGGIMLAVLIIFGVSCKKSSDPPTPTPEYPQLAGTWFGLTSDNDTIGLIVANVAGYMKVTAYTYKVSYIVSGQTYIHQTEQINSDGFCSVAGKTFSLNPLMPLGSTADTLNGTFNVTSLTVTGNIKATFTEVTGSPVVRLTYTGAKMLVGK